MDAPSIQSNSTQFNNSSIAPSQQRRQPEVSFCGFDVVEDYHRRNANKRQTVTSDLSKKINDVTLRNKVIEEMYNKSKKNSDSSITDKYGTRNSKSNEKLLQRRKKNKSKTYQDDPKISEVNKRRTVSCEPNRDRVYKKHESEDRNSSTETNAKNSGDICQNCSGYVRDNDRRNNRRKHKHKDQGGITAPEKVITVFRNVDVPKIKHPEEAMTKNVITVYENARATDVSESIESKEFKQYIKDVQKCGDIARKDDENKKRSKLKKESNKLKKERGVEDSVDGRKTKKKTSEYSAAGKITEHVIVVEQNVIKCVNNSTLRGDDEKLTDNVSFLTHDGRKKNGDILIPTHDVKKLFRKYQTDDVLFPNKRERSLIGKKHFGDVLIPTRDDKSTITGDNALKLENYSHLNVDESMKQLMEVYKKEHERIPREKEFRTTIPKSPDCKLKHHSRKLDRVKQINRKELSFSNLNLSPVRGIYSNLEKTKAVTTQTSKNVYINDYASSEKGSSQTTLNKPSEVDCSEKESSQTIQALRDIYKIAELQNSSRRSAKRRSDKSSAVSDVTTKQDTAGVSKKRDKIRNIAQNNKFHTSKTVTPNERIVEISSRILKDDEKVSFTVEGIEPAKRLHGESSIQKISKNHNLAKQVFPGIDINLSDVKLLNHGASKISKDSLELPKTFPLQENVVAPMKELSAVMSFHRAKTPFNLFCIKKDSAKKCARKCEKKLEFLHNKTFFLQNKNSLFAQKPFDVTDSSTQTTVKDESHIPIRSEAKRKPENAGKSTDKNSSAQISELTETECKKPNEGNSVRRRSATTAAEISFGYSPNRTTGKSTEENDLNKPPGKSGECSPKRVVKSTETNDLGRSTEKVGYSPERLSAKSTDARTSARSTERRFGCSPGRFTRKITDRNHEATVGKHPRRNRSQEIKERIRIFPERKRSSSVMKPSAVFNKSHLRTEVDLIPCKSSSLKNMADCVLRKCNRSRSLNRSSDSAIWENDERVLSGRANKSQSLISIGKSSYKSIFEVSNCVLHTSIDRMHGKLNVAYQERQFHDNVRTNLRKQDRCINKSTVPRLNNHHEAENPTTNRKSLKTNNQVMNCMIDGVLRYPDDTSSQQNRGSDEENVGDELLEILPNQDYKENIREYVSSNSNVDQVRADRSFRPQNVRDGRSSWLHCNNKRFGEESPTSSNERNLERYRNENEHFSRHTDPFTRHVLVEQNSKYSNRFVDEGMESERFRKDFNGSQKWSAENRNERGRSFTEQQNEERFYQRNSNLCSDWESIHKTDSRREYEGTSKNSKRFHDDVLNDTNVASTSKPQPEEYQCEWEGNYMKTPNREHNKIRGRRTKEENRFPEDRDRRSSESPKLFSEENLFERRNEEYEDERFSEDRLHRVSEEFNNNRASDGVVIQSNQVEEYSSTTLPNHVCRGRKGRNEVRKSSHEQDSVDSNIVKSRRGSSNYRTSVNSNEQNTTRRCSKERNNNQSNRLRSSSKEKSNKINDQHVDKGIRRASVSPNETKPRHDLTPVTVSQHEGKSSIERREHIARPLASSNADKMKRRWSIGRYEHTPRTSVSPNTDKLKRRSSIERQEHKPRTSVSPNEDKMKRRSSIDRQEHLSRTSVKPHEDKMRRRYSIESKTRLPIGPSKETTSQGCSNEQNGRTLEEKTMETNDNCDKNTSNGLEEQSKRYIRCDDVGETIERQNSGETINCHRKEIQALEKCLNEILIKLSKDDNKKTSSAISKVTTEAEPCEPKQEDSKSEAHKTEVKLIEPKQKHPKVASKSVCCEINISDEIAKMRKECSSLSKHEDQGFDEIIHKAQKNLLRKQKLYRWQKNLSRLNLHYKKGADFNVKNRKPSTKRYHDYTMNRKRMFTITGVESVYKNKNGFVSSSTNLSSQLSESCDLSSLYPKSIQSLELVQNITFYDSSSSSSTKEIQTVFRRKSSENRRIIARKKKKRALDDLKKMVKKNKLSVSQITESISNVVILSVSTVGNTNTKKRKRFNSKNKEISETSSSVSFPKKSGLSACFFSLSDKKNCNELPKDSGLISKEPFYMNVHEVKSKTSTDSLEILPYDTVDLCPLTAFFNYTPPTYAYHVYNAITIPNNQNAAKDAPPSFVAPATSSNSNDTPLVLTTWANTECCSKDSNHDDDSLFSVLKPKYTRSPTLISSKFSRAKEIEEHKPHLCKFADISEAYNNIKINYTSKTNTPIPKSNPDPITKQTFQQLSESPSNVSTSTSTIRDMVYSNESGYESSKPSKSNSIKNFFKKGGSLLDIFKTTRKKPPVKKCVSSDTSTTLQTIEEDASVTSCTSTDSKTVLWFNFCKKKKGAPCGKECKYIPDFETCRESCCKKAHFSLNRGTNTSSTSSRFFGRRCTCMSDMERQKLECKHYAEKVILEATLRKEGYRKQYTDFKEIPLDVLMGKSLQQPVVSRKCECVKTVTPKSIQTEPVEPKKEPEKVTIEEPVMEQVEEQELQEEEQEEEKELPAAVDELETTSSPYITTSGIIEKSRSQSKEKINGKSSAESSLTERKLTDKEVFDNLLQNFERKSSIAERLSQDDEFFNEQLQTVSSETKRDSNLAKSSHIIIKTSDSAERVADGRFRGPRFTDKAQPVVGKMDCTVNADDIGTCFARGFRPDNLMLSGDACFNLNKQDKIKMSPQMLKNTESIIDFSERETPLDFLLALGFMVDEASNALKDDDIRSRLLAAITEARVWINKITTTQGTLLYLVAYKARPETMRYFLQLVEAIINRRINNAIKLDGFLRVLEQIEDGRIQMINILGEDKFEDEENEEKIVKKQLKNLFATVYAVAEAEAMQAHKDLSYAQVGLLRMLVSKYRSGLQPHLELIARYIGQELLDSEVQLEAAMIFLSRLDTADVKLKEFENYCGILCEKK